MEPDQVTTSAPLELDLSSLPAASPEDKSLGAAGAELAGQEPAPGGVPPGAAPALTEEQKKKLEATGLAAMIVELGAQVAARRWPVITFGDDEKHALVEAAVPVLVKYDVRAAWLEQYKEELALGQVLLGIIVAKRAQVEEAAAKKAKEAPKPAAASSSSSSSAAGEVVTTALDGAVPDPLAHLRRS